MAVKNLIIKIGVQGGRKAIGAIKGVSKGLLGVARAAKNAIFSMKGLAGAAGMGLVIKAAGDLEKGLLEINTLLSPKDPKSLNRNMVLLSQNLQKVARETGQALTPLIKANYDVISAGFTNIALSAELVGQSARLATAGNTDVATSADILTTALNAYGLEADKAEEVSDMLFTTVRLGKTTMAELGSSLGQVLPFAKSAKASLDDVGAAMAILTAKGIDTARSATALRSTFRLLASPTEGMKKAMDNAKVSVKLLDDGSLDLIGTMKEFAKVPVDSITKVIPNVEAMVAILNLRNDIEGLEGQLGEFATKAGATQTAFEIMAEGFNFKLSVMRENFRSVMLAIGKVIVKIIKPHVERANEILGDLGDIGWDNIGTAINQNWSTIMVKFDEIAQTTFKLIQLRAKVFALKMRAELEAAIPFGETGQKSIEEAAKAEEVIGVLFRTLKLQGTQTFEFIVAEGKKAAEAQRAELEITTDAYKPLKDAILDVGDATGDAGDELNKYGKETKQYTTIVMSAFANAFDPSKTAGEKLKSFMISVVSLFQQAVVASAEVAKSISMMFTGPIGVGTAIAALAVLAGVKAMIQGMKFAQFGMDEVVSQPTLIMAGEGNKRERVTVTPLDSANARGGEGGGGAITINVSAPLVDETIVDSIIPAIQKANRLGIA